MNGNLLKDRVERSFSMIQQGQSLSEQEGIGLVKEVIEALESGKIAVVSYDDETASWKVNLWVKQAILLALRLFPAVWIEEKWWDKIPLLDFEKIPVDLRPRYVPGAFVRRGAYVAPRAILMPSFINMGAWVGEGTMIDAGCVVGSCAFVGARCHISSNVTLGGVLEPIQDQPVIIEEGTFIGAGSHILEGMHIGAGSVIGAGVVLTKSTKIVTRATREIHYGFIPKGSVVVSGTWGEEGLGITCAVIVKTVDAQTRQKTALTELLRLP